ncbi:hypothetical protein BGX38DRAFT_1169017 [Terfezia claveryi]|nr:hypothetical protein BGX38DRAFT_1169017 [Terfezia claveryi]
MWPYEVVNALPERGASIDATNRLNWTALRTAVQYGHIEVANALLEKGASIDATGNRNRTESRQEICLTARGYVRARIALGRHRAETFAGDPST